MPTCAHTYGSPSELLQVVELLGTQTAMSELLPYTQGPLLFPGPTPPAPVSAAELRPRLGACVPGLEPVGSSLALLLLLSLCLFHFDWPFNDLTWPVSSPA